jgi:7,8-dihydroneopterin aldolase/epimerase/oxygenase
LATLVLSRIGFEGRHGASAAERRTTRRFEVDVEIEASVERAEISDRLADTIDFGAVADVIVAIGTGKAHHLLESLAHQMLVALVDRFPHATIRLEVRKLAPPYCAGNPAYAAVRLAHARRP